jgi:Holliday junction resolvase
MKESFIQRQIIVKLESWGWMVVKLIQTNTNGIPDLMAIRNGKTVFIEVKRDGEQPAPLQKHRLNQINDKGILAFWADNAEDINFLKTY